MQSSAEARGAAVSALLSAIEDLTAAHDVDAISAIRVALLHLGPLIGNTDIRLLDMPYREAVKRRLAENI